MKCYLFLLILCWYCHDVFSINVYKKKEKKEEQFKHSSRRNTKVCTNTSPNICTRYKLALYRVLEVYILPGWEASRQRVRLFFRLESTDRTRFGGVLAVSWFCLSGNSHKRRFHSDNVPIHSATCSCFEYDGVLLLIITITVLVIINNYLMVWRSFAWWDFSVYCFLDNSHSHNLLGFFVVFFPICDHKFNFFFERILTFDACQLHFRESHLRCVSAAVCNRA